MKTAKKRTDRENAATTGSGEANTQLQEAVLTVVKDADQYEAEQHEAGHKQQQQPAQQEAAVKTLTVAEKLAVLKELDRVAFQRSNLIGMQDRLKSFVIEQNEAAELDEGDQYKTCELMIKDDNGKVFSTKNTSLIAASVDHLLTKSEIRLAELDALLVFPAA